MAPPVAPSALDPARLRPGTRRVVAALAILFGVLGVASRVAALQPSSITRNEFTEDYVAARAAFAHDNPYADTEALLDRYGGPNHPYERAPVVLRDPHTPAQILLVRPVSFLAYRSARSVWLLLGALAIAFSVGLVVRELGWSRGTAAVAGVGALALPVAQKELLYGNVNGLVLFGIVGSWLALRRERWSATGVALGAVSALKLYPLLLLIPLIRARRWRAVAACMATTLVLSVVGFVALPGVTVDRFRSSTGSNLAFWRAAPMNLSAVMAPFRWLAKSYWRPDAAEHAAVAAAVALVIAIACIGAMWLTPGRRSDPFLAAVPIMLLASPLVWEHYLVLCFPSIIAAIAGAAARDKPPGLLYILAASMIVIGLLPGVDTPSPPPAIAMLVFGYGLPTYALVVLAALEWKGSTPVPGASL